MYSVSDFSWFFSLLYLWVKFIDIDFIIFFDVIFSEIIESVRLGVGVEGGLNLGLF